MCARSSEGAIEENASGLVQERKADSERRKLRVVRNDNGWGFARIEKNSGPSAPVRNHKDDEV